MKTRCPQCNTHYDVVPEALAAARGIVRCFSCGTLFNVNDNPPSSKVAADTSADKPEPKAANTGNRFSADDNRPAMRAIPGLTANDKIEENTKDSATTPEEAAAQLGLRQPNKTHWSQVVFAFALLLLLGSQLGWHNRSELLPLFPFKQLCTQIDCSIAQQYKPDDFSVTEHYLAPDPQHNEALRLDISFRNNASYAQAYPVLQINLYDSNEFVVARRHLKPHEYMYPVPNNKQKIQAQEIVQLNLSLLDPGTHASGFRINFL